MIAPGRIGEGEDPAGAIIRTRMDGGDSHIAEGGSFVDESNSAPFLC